MILVTGAGGFIGSQVCRLLSTQYAVLAIDQHFAITQSYPQLSGDLGKTDFLAEVMRTGSFDTIIHLAAVLNTRSGQQPDEALRVGGEIQRQSIVSVSRMNLTTGRSPCGNTLDSSFR
jgi:nucleoside-diphosphate-sugar epimerase